MSDDFIRLMHSLFLPAAQSCREARWSPAADVYQTREGWLVKLDLAGIRSEDVQVQVKGRRLTVCGQRHDCILQEGASHYRLEIAYSHFERSLDLPDDLERASLRTEYRDGMLLVHITRKNHS
jgi:HSP20 family protein